MTRPVMARTKRHTNNLTAIVTVADDGGGSGVLRQELGMPPAVVAAGTANSRYQHRLALLPVQRQDEAEEIPQLLHKLLRFPERKHVIPNLLIQAGLAPQGINVKRVGHEPDIKDQIRPIIKRYKETRRIHPLQEVAGSLETAVNQEVALCKKGWA